MRRTLFSALAFALLLVSMTALAADTIVFGAAISITGKTAKEGGYTRDGYQIAIDKINEMGGIKVGGKTYKLELKYYDDETKPERTAQLIEKLINEDKVNLILGPYGSSPTGTAAPLVERYKIPMVEANGSAEAIFSKGYKYTFMILSPAKLYLRGIIDAVRAKDPSAKTVAILGENEAFSKEVAGGASEYAKEKGMTIVKPSEQLNADLQKVGNYMLVERLRKSGDDGRKVIDAYRAM
jgi:branched-chain amino acid transport system substrate-binding protein